MARTERDEKLKADDDTEVRRTRELRLDEERFEKKKEFELKLEAEKLKRTHDEKLKAKLPKLQISKFDGSFIDWLRFWQQFEEEIDKCTNYAAITKFSYVRELLSDQPKSEISGLPFTEGGYENAKDVLMKKYGVTSEIIHAHGKSILQLPTIHKEYNLKTVHDFYRYH